MSILAALRAFWEHLLRGLEDHVEDFPETIEDLAMKDKLKYLQPLLDLIGRVESRGNYNAKFSKSKSTEDLSKYTLDQIHDMQRRWGRLTGSSAFGKYQIIRKTLLGLRDQMDLPGSKKFTPELQDQMAEQLLINRGLMRFLAGRMSTKSFADAISKEWASLPYRTGRSYYAGDSIGNKSLVSRNEVFAALEEVRRNAS